MAKCPVKGHFFVKTCKSHNICCSLRVCILYYLDFPLLNTKWRRSVPWWGDHRHVYPVRWWCGWLGVYKALFVLLLPRQVFSECIISLQNVTTTSLVLNRKGGAIAINTMNSYPTEDGLLLTCGFVSLNRSLGLPSTMNLWSEKHVSEQYSPRTVSPPSISIKKKKKQVYIYIYLNGRWRL